MLAFTHSIYTYTDTTRVSMYVQYVRVCACVVLKYPIVFLICGFPASLCVDWRSQRVLALLLLCLRYPGWFLVLIGVAKWTGLVALALQLAETRKQGVEMSS